MTFGLICVQFVERTKYIKYMSLSFDVTMQQSAEVLKSKMSTIFINVVRYTVCNTEQRAKQYIALCYTD